MDISIIIVNFNQKQMLVNCVKSILENSPKASFQIFIVDNGSTDGSAEYIERHFPEINLIKNQKNLGFARANNQALLLSESRYVLLLNNDTIVLPGTIDNMIDFMDSHPDAGLSGCKLLNSDGSLQPSTFGSQSVFKIFLRLTGIRFLLPKSAFWRRTIPKLPLHLQNFFPGYWEHDAIRTVGTVMGAFFLMRSATVRDVGLLDDTTFMYHEEGDWAYRAGAKGWKVYFVPISGVIHFGGPNKSIKNTPPKILVEQHKGILNLFKKHHGGVEFYLVKILIISISSVKYLFWNIVLNLSFGGGKSSIYNKVTAYKQIVKMAYMF